MDLNQILNSLRVVQLPMRTKFRGITTREVALFEGPAGWGEFSPFL
ncbi:MAG: O-succinylbenzoate synthase, partial [Candidatus Nanopelagicaceae bacterium]